MANALTTTERVKNRLTITETGFDTLFNNLILAVTKRIENMTGRQFTLATYTNEIHDGSDFYNSHRTILVPKNAPIANVASLQYNGGSNSLPVWVNFPVNDYTVDYEAGLIYVHGGLPRGKRNIRITYTAGWDGFAIGLTSRWNFNIVPTGAVNGVNATYTLPGDADELIVYADGIRLASANVSFTAGTDTFTIATSPVNLAPFTTISVDYRITTGTASGEETLPDDIVDVCERAVIHLFKKRNSEGKSSEGFMESQITWEKAVFNDEMLATIKNYRRGYDL